MQTCSLTILLRLLILLSVSFTALGAIRGPITHSKIIGADELAPVTVVAEDDQYKLVVKATNVPQPLGGLFFTYATLAGSNEMAVNGNTAKVFTITSDPTRDMIVSGLLFEALDGGMKIDTFLGMNSALTNGLSIEIKSEDEVFQFLAIKNTTEFNSHFSYGSGRSFDIIFASGGDSLVARFGLQNPFIIKKTGTYATPDYINVTVRDNISAVDRLRFIASGSKE